MTAAAVTRADYAVARILATSEADDSLYPRLLEAIGTALGWNFGALWKPADGESLRCVATWCSPGLDAGDFVRETAENSFGPGEGLPGRVWSSGEPAWVADVQRDQNFPRAGAAAAAGVTSAFCFPLRSGRGPLGAIEFFSLEPHGLDAELLATMASLGSQIGQFVERRRAEAEVHRGNEFRRAMMESALDCLITIDERGRVLDFNPAAERTFGHPASEVIGRDMADLIVPPSLRERHREGFTRHLATGEAKILGRRLEITGMRSDGSEFPVELTITRIEVPGPPRFTGYLRDISDRRAAEAELRASRMRIVEAADAERRRLERNLHDGAQQRLVNLGLTLRLARGRLNGDDEAAALVDEALAELSLATTELRELARGIHPAVLRSGGLEAALSGLVARSKGNVKLIETPSERLPERVEATAYFVVAEALTNVARYAEASSTEVRAARDGETLVVEVADDGRGGARAGAGSGLRGLADRVSAIGGEFEVISPDDRGTVVRATIPCAYS